ncbi:MAG: GntR family transcriptional regulator [Brevundimonas sp.]|jgi:DNA-binding GntR family transcriptional regulator
MDLLDKSPPSKIAGPADTQERQIADALIQDIMEWRLPPGTWIREREIAERFQVSHAPVREAFRRVERAGFVELTPYRGARVIEIDAHAANELIECWKALYGVVCRLAAENFKGDDGPLMRHLEKYEAIIAATPDPAQHVPVGFELGRLIRDSAGGSLAPQLLSKVGRLVRWQHKLLSEEDIAYGSPGASQQSAELHRRLVEAIVSNRPDDADKTARDVIALTQKVLILAIEARLAEITGTRPLPLRKRRRRAAATA